MNVVAFIFARGGSKGLPGKNIRELCGRPLIAWSIEQARASKARPRVIVSTDDSEIAQVAKAHGAEVPFLRPAELASDHSPEWLAWRHALNWYAEVHDGLPDAMMSVPTTAPLRLPSDLDACLDRFAQGDVDAVVTVSESHRSPYFNMVRADEHGYVHVFSPLPTGVTRRQDAPQVYDMATVAYVVRPEFVMRQDSLFSGRVAAVELPKNRCADIDTLEDFEWAQYLMERRLAKRA